MTASSPPPPLPNLERVIEVGEIFSPSRDHHIPEMPHSSPPPSEHVPDEMPQPSPAHTEQVHHEIPQSSQQAQPIHEQRVPPEEGDAQEDEDVPEWELRKKHPITIRPVYVPIKDVSSVSKWYSHDQFKPENQVKKSHHGLLRRPSLANSTKQQSSIQMLMPSNGQRIARKHMKEASPSYQTRTFSAYHLE